MNEGIYRGGTWNEEFVHKMFRMEDLREKCHISTAVPAVVDRVGKSSDLEMSWRNPSATENLRSLKHENQFHSHFRLIFIIIEE